MRFLGAGAFERAGQQDVRAAVGLCEQRPFQRGVLDRHEWVGLGRHGRVRLGCPTA
jgi:hypothetical protein